MRILLADDYEDSARGMARYLELAGYEVAVALDGISAFNTALAVRPHIALVDLAIPGLDGHSLARCFRAEPLLRDTTLVCLTGRMLSASESQELMGTFDRVLMKPVLGESLIEVLGLLSHDFAH